MEQKHPDQPMVITEDDVIRFKENRIVRKLLKISSEKGFSLNEIYLDVLEGNYDREDYVQLMQLIGYSFSGYSELSCVNDEEYERAEKQYEELSEKLK